MTLRRNSKLNTDHTDANGSIVGCLRLPYDWTNPSIGHRPMDIDDEGMARTKGVNPAARRLQLGMSAIVERPDGTVVELFPDGREVVLHRSKEPAEHSEPDLSDDFDGPSF